MDPKEVRERLRQAIAYCNQLAGFLGSMEPGNRGEKHLVAEAKAKLSDLSAHLWRLWLLVGPDGKAYQNAVEAAELESKQKGG